MISESPTADSRVGWKFRTIFLQNKNQFRVVAFIFYRKTFSPNVQQRRSANFGGRARGLWNSFGVVYVFDKIPLTKFEKKPKRKKN
jgi:hypothetical protein